MANAPFAIQPHYTAIALAFRNPAVNLIADLVLPRIQVSKQEFRWTKRALAEGYTIPDTKVGRRGRPNEVEFTDTELPGATVDFALDDSVPQNDINNAPPNHDPVARAVESLTDLILLDREKRVAAKVFAQATYAASNRVALTGTDQWNDFTNSDPIDDVNTALDTPVLRPNTLVFGRAAFAKFAMHPKVVKAVHGNDGDSGIARKAQIAELFEVQQVLVGEGFVNSAKKGQAVSLARVWGKHMAALHINPMADTGRGLTFGFTAEFGSRIAGATPDGDIGMRGGMRARVGESVAEIIAANELGYFIENAIA